MSDDQAYAAFRAVRFAENGGEPFCPHCECKAVYEYQSRRVFKCKRCERQFSATSGTLFADRKLSYRDLLFAIALFVNGANGYPALRLGRDLNVSYKTAWVLLHKLREAMGAIQAGEPLTGDIDADGLFLGGHIRELNLKADREKAMAEKRKARRDAQQQGYGMPLNKNEEKRVCIVTFRERRKGGRSRAFVFQREHMAVSIVSDVVEPKARLITDAGPHWGALDIDFDRQEVNHSIGHMVNGIHINGVEAYHSRIRRAERGVYLHLTGRHLQNFADELTWRDDHRRVSNGQQYRIVLGQAAKQPKSKVWVGHWQKRPARQAAGLTNA